MTYRTREDYEQAEDSGITHRGWWPEPCCGEDPCICPSAYARELLAAHDRLRAASAEEPPQTAANHHRWLDWYHGTYRGAYDAWGDAMDRFNKATGLTSRHPANFRPAAEAILSEEPRP